MECKLCSESPEDSEQLIRTDSEEGLRLNVKQIIRKHFELELGFPNANIYICRSCCKIVCDFHELYLKVERTQKRALQDVLDQTDSDEPLAALRNELKEEGEIKLEPQHENWTVRPVTGHATKRRSKRIVAQRASLNASHPQFEYTALIDIENIKREEVFLETMDVDALNEVSNADNESFGEAEADEIGQAVDKLMNTDELNVKSVNKKVKKVKRRGRKIKRISSPPLIKHPSSKTQISKGYDEFLAENFKLSCCLCQDSLPDFTALKTHFRMQHHTRGYALCCGKKLLKRGVLVDHIRTHIDPEFFKCSTCNKVAASRRCLELHMRLHEKRPERTFQCEICSKSYFRKSVFLRHIQMHAPEDEKKINCPQCEKVFVTTYMMNQHLKLVHLNLYAKVCEICGKSIRGREAFQRHQLEHNGTPKPLVQCDLCGIKLTNKYGLARHMKTMHTEENLSPQMCTICSKASPTMSAHQRHMRYVHSMERKHACRMCEKAFKRAQDLREHMTTHTGEVLYTCPHCPKTFNSNANMYSHRKKVHRKEWEEKRKERYIKQSSTLVQNRQELENVCNSIDEPNSTLNSDGVECKPDNCIDELRVNQIAQGADILQ